MEFRAWTNVQFVHFKRHLKQKSPTLTPLYGLCVVSFLQSARTLTWTLLQLNLLSKRITACVGFSIGRLGICLGRQNFKGCTSFEKSKLSTQHCFWLFMNIFVCTQITKMDAIRHVFWVPDILNYAFATGALPGTPLGELTALPGPPSWQCRINHCMWEGSPTNCLFFYHAILTSERWENVHK